MAFDPNNPPPGLSPSDYPSSGVGVSRTPTVGVRARPQMGPPIPPGGVKPPDLDFSMLGDDSLGLGRPSSPMPATRVQGNPFFNFLSSLFGNSGGPAQAQGMTGLLQSPARPNRSVDVLGNPVNRF